MEWRMHGASAVPGSDWRVEVWLLQGRRLGAGHARDSHLPVGIADIPVFAGVRSGLHRLSVQLGLMLWN